MFKRFLTSLFRGLFFSFFTFIDLLSIGFVAFIITVTVSIPEIKDRSSLQLERKKVGTDFYTINNNWIKKSDTGLWEIYIEGDGFERGVIEGKLNKELAEKQEVAFLEQIQVMIPSRAMLNYLKFFIAFFNRDLDKHITDEYKEEIYGESLFASDKFDFVAPKYYRMLNYHAAHDIGHALQDKNMTVGCTAFGAWGSKTEDSTLLIARNFDFYVGDKFAEDKLINFVAPKNGYKLIMVSWAGMIGTVSGMNEKGLTVTINASKSEIPTGAATPISLLAREILQYAKNIDEAFAIAQKRKTFVSESILIGSKEDKRSATIEKTPSKTELFTAPQPEYLICANHYQGKAFANDPVNIENIEKSSSNYRLKRLEELIGKEPQISVPEAVAMMRNRGGLNDKNIGMGNEKSLNQLIAHHAVVFKPEKLQVWISTNPFQLGQFVCYDLNKVFAEAPGLKEKKELYVKELNIPADPFVNSTDFKKFDAYKKMRTLFRFIQKHELKYPIEDALIQKFINCNPEYFETDVYLGNYYKLQGDNYNAWQYYRKALTKEITTQQDRDMIQFEIDNTPLEFVHFQF